MVVNVALAASAWLARLVHFVLRFSLFHFSNGDLYRARRDDDELNGWRRTGLCRVGSGQGNPSILSLLVLSRADISESTQNHFELI